MIVSNGWKREERVAVVEVVMSPGRKEMLGTKREASSALLEGMVVDRVEGRRRTVILVVRGARAARLVRMVVPSSLSLRTRILVVVMTGNV
jgi:hypothetical protein